MAHRDPVAVEHARHVRLERVVQAQQPRVGELQDQRGDKRLGDTANTHAIGFLQRGACRRGPLYPERAPRCRGSGSRRRPTRLARQSSPGACRGSSAAWPRTAAENTALSARVRALPLRASSASAAIRRPAKRIGIGCTFPSHRASHARGWRRLNPQVDALLVVQLHNHSL